MSKNPSLVWSPLRRMMLLARAWRPERAWSVDRPLPTFNRADLTLFWRWGRIAGMVTIDHSGRFGLVFGVANHRSLAAAIGQKLSASGARLAFAYQNERLKDMVDKATGDIPNRTLLECDVTRDDDLERTFGRVKEEFGALDFLVHSVAFAQKEDLEGAYRNTSRDGFRVA